MRIGITNNRVRGTAMEQPAEHTLGQRRGENTMIGTRKGIARGLNYEKTLRETVR